MSINKTLDTIGSVIETASNPIIKYGGKSSSDVLQKISDNFRSDLLTISNEVTDVSNAIGTTQSIFVIQAASLASSFSTFTNLLSSLTSAIATAQNKALIDMHSTKCVESTHLSGTSNNMADVSPTYGQATLKITNSQDKLVVEDINGDIWVPNSVELGYCYKSVGTTPPQSNEYIIDTDYDLAIDKKIDTVWMKTAASTGDIWLSIKVPTEYSTNTLANCLVLHPFPALTHDLIAVYLVDESGILSPLDLSYLTGYNTATTIVEAFGNSRLLFEPRNVSQIIIHMRIDNSDNLYWGFSRIELKLLDFAATSDLNINVGNIVSNPVYNAPVYTLYGKDPSALAFLSSTILDKNVEYSLVQKIAGTSPVITSIEASWSS